jgi:outer membrane protein assembly factor BamB
MLLLHLSTLESPESPETPASPGVDRRPGLPGWFERSRVDHRSRNRFRLALGGGLAGGLALVLILGWIYWFSLPNPARWFVGQPDTVATSASRTGQWSMLGHRSALNGYVAEVDSQPRGELAWSHDLGNPTRSAPLAADGLVFVGGHFAIMAVNASTGERVWTVEAPGPMDHALTVANNGLVFAGQTNHRILALNRETGATVWEFQADLPITASALVHDGIAYVTSAANVIYALDAQSGEKLWSKKIKGNVKTTPAVAGDHLFVADDEGNMYKLDADRGRQRFRYRSAGSASGPPVIADGVVYFPSSGSLYAVDATVKGMPGLFWIKRAWLQLWIWQIPFIPAPPAQRGDIWRFFPQDRSSQGVIGSPAVVDGVYYVGDSDGVFYARDAGADQELWRFTVGDAVVSSPIVLGDRVYFGARDGILYALDRNDARVAWQLDLGAPVELPVAYADGRLFVRTSDGMLHAVD